MPPVHVRHPEGWWTVSVRMAERDRVKAEVAAGNVSYLLRNAAAIFDLINSGLASGFIDEKAELLALTETCARAYRAMAEDEGEVMDTLQRALQSAAGQMPPAPDEGVEP